MTTFNQIIVACPHCGIKMTDYELMSFTIHNSTVYSDGLTVTEPWMNNDKAIALCHSCQKVFWREDAILDKDEIPEEDFPSAGDVHDLPFALSDTFREELIRFYVGLLKEGFANTVEKKVYLRLRIWWGINDFIRYKKPLLKLMVQSGNWKRFKTGLTSQKRSRAIFADFKPIFTENLEKLIAQFKPEFEDDKILLAEMYRELGEMAQAKKVLNGLEDKTNCGRISTAVDRNKRQVMKL